MVEKPKIQYVGQFYVHGSEAPKLEPKKPVRKAKTRLPLERLQKIETIYLDPVAVFAIAVALVLMVAMLAGVYQIQDDWQDYRAAAGLLDKLSQENARLEQEYHASFNLEEIRRKAEALGLIPMDQVKVKSVTVTMPEPIPEVDPFTAWVEHIRWFWNGLWA